MFNLIPWRKKEKKSDQLVPHKEHPLEQLREEFDALFDRFLSRWVEPFGMDFGLSRFWGFDLEEKDDEVVIRAEVPGFEPGDLDVQLSGNLLTIKAEKKEETKGKRGDGRYEEQRYRTFRRTVTLPRGIDPSKIEARYHNGLLEVHVPRSEQARPKRITVKAA
ncbi:MAG TPA: Hsp20/alpha crystallin family protein [Gemmataceae bacterium]|nr:Hsp20/alpha crystallin family protein [Gemmataceae bacterium]